MSDKQLTEKSAHDNTGAENTQLLHEKIILLRHTLLQANYDNSAVRHGLRQILNRILILIQEPACLVVFNKKADSTKADSTFQLVMHTLTDPLYKEDFEAFLALESELVGEHLYFSEPKYTEVVSHNRLFQQLHLAIFTIGFSDDKEKRINFSLYDDEELRTGTMVQMLSPRRMRDLFSDDLLLDLGKQTDSWHKGSYLVGKPTLKGDAISRSMEDEQYEKISKLFDQEYSRVYSSALLKKKSKRPSNIFFFVKTYTQQGSRFTKNGAIPDGNYQHSVRSIIPEKQRKDLKSGFMWLARRFKAGDIKESERFAARNKGGGFVDDFFWNLLMQGEISEDAIEAEHHGIDTIFKEMCDPYGRDARSFADPVLASGYVHIKNTPFARGGIARLDASAWNKEAKSLDFRRMVYFHYAMTCVMPPSSEKSILTVPCYVGGTTWFTASFLTDRAGTDLAGRWYDNFYFYHSVYVYMVRNIRRRIFDLYLDEISAHYLEALIKPLEPYLNHGGRVAMHKVAELMNDHCLKLARIYPFSYLYFTALNKGEQERITQKRPEFSEVEFYHQYLSTLYLKVEIKANPYFPAQINGNYSPARRFVKALRTADNTLLKQAQKIHFLQKKKQQEQKDAGE